MSELVFNGVTAFARIEEQRWSAPLLAIRPHKAQFTYVAVAPERLISAAPIANASHAHWSLELRGEFSRTGDGRGKIVGPMADRDAIAMCEALVRRYDLPRRPIEVAAREIASLPAHSYVVVTGHYRKGHSESPNFDGVRLHADGLVHDRTYRVTGFTTPGIAMDRPTVGIAPGYNGPTLTAVELEPIDDL